MSQNGANATERILQEYLQALSEEHKQPGPQRARRLLTSYAEFRFRVAGGSQCPLCRASVRHVLPVTVLRRSGEKVSYACLCHRCVEAERGEAESVEIGLDDIKWVLKGRD